MDKEKFNKIIQNEPELSLLLKTSFKAFIKVFHYYLFNENFIFKSFHNTIIDKLENLVFNYNTNPKKNLCINLPPRFGKTFLMKYFIAWTYTINKKANNICTSYSEELILDFSNDIKNIVNSPLYYKLFSLELDKNSKSKTIWSIKEGGETRAVSLGGGITGFGAGTMELDKYGGALIIDDPLKVIESKSVTYREKCIDYYKSTLKTRLNNKNTPIILIMQRLHTDDLTSYVTKNEFLDWDFVKISLRDKNGKSVWEDKWSDDAIKFLEENDKYNFYSQYQQEPYNDTSSSPFAEHEPVNYFGKDKCIGWIDPSHKGKDYTAFCLIKRNFSDMVVLGFLFKKSWDTCLDEIATISNEFQCNKLIIETNGIGNIAIKLLSDLGANVSGYETRQNKEQKIMACGVYNQNIKLSNATDIYKMENKTFIDNVKNWYIGTRDNDDGIDAMSSLLWYMGIVRT
jgi:hypothetical protein